MKNNGNPELFSVPEAKEPTESAQQESELCPKCGHQLDLQDRNPETWWCPMCRRYVNLASQQ